MERGGINQGFLFSAVTGETMSETMWKPRCPSCRTPPLHCHSFPFYFRSFPLLSLSLLLWLSCCLVCPRFVILLPTIFFQARATSLSDPRSCCSFSLHWIQFQSFMGLSELYKRRGGLLFVLLCLFSSGDCHILTLSRIPPQNHLYYLLPSLSRFSLSLSPHCTFTLLPYPSVRSSRASQRRKNTFFTMRKNRWSSSDNRQLRLNRLNTGDYKCVWRNVRSVCAWKYMQIRENMQMNAPNWDVNYSARLIIICLMRRKVEERSEMEGLP